MAGNIKNSKRKMERRPQLDCPELVHTVLMGGKPVSYPQTVGFFDGKHEFTMGLKRAIALGLVAVGEVALERISWSEIPDYFKRKGVPIPWQRKKP